MEAREEELVEAALTYIEELVYPRDVDQSDTERMAGARQLPLDDLLQLIHLAQKRFAYSGVGSVEVIEGLCRGTVGAPDEASRRIRALYALSSQWDEARMGLGAFSRTMESIVGDAPFPDWADAAQRAAIVPLLRFALASTASPPRPGVEHRIDGSVHYTDPLLRKAVEDHPSQTELIIRLYCAAGMRLPKLLEMLDGASALADGAL